MKSTKLSEDLIEFFSAAIEKVNDRKKKKEYQKIIDVEAVYIAKTLSRVFKTNRLKNILDIATKEKIHDFLDLTIAYYMKNKAKHQKSDKLFPKDYDWIRQRIDITNLIFSNKLDLQIAYEETILFELHHVECPICGNQMIFQKGSKYNKYICNNGCDSLVTCHPHTALPAGLVANKEVRMLRADLHNITSQVFRSSRKNLYAFLEKMLGRTFNNLEGHIGSMNKIECQKMIRLFAFLTERAYYLNKTRLFSEKDYLLEENFISTATHREMQAYYIMLKRFSSFNAFKNLCTSIEDYHELVFSLIKKGIPFPQTNDDCSLNSTIQKACCVRENLAQQLLLLDENSRKRIVYF